MTHPESGSAGSNRRPSGITVPDRRVGMDVPSDSSDDTVDMRQEASRQRSRSSELTRKRGVKSDNPTVDGLAERGRSGATLAEEPIRDQVPSYDQPHSRMDVISGRWTLFANHRNDRPCDFEFTVAPKLTATDCPFCRGNEAATPDPVLVLNRTAPSAEHVRERGDDWLIRVVPNRYPAVATAEGLPPNTLVKDTPKGEARVSSAEEIGGLFPARRVSGGHEVFIESPDHVSSLVELDPTQVVSLLEVFQSRLDFWSSQPTTRYVSLFKNSGAAAGASLMHPHSQLIALSQLPQTVRGVVDRFRRYQAKTGCCLQCDILRAELRSSERLVAATERLVAYCPFASYLPMLLRITTRRHLGRFEELDKAEIAELAHLIRQAIGWLHQLYPGVAYNFLIHTRPPGIGNPEGYHWSFELFPRLTQIAGFEWSSDTIINPLLPEDSADRYRKASHAQSPSPGHAGS